MSENKNVSMTELRQAYEREILTTDDVGEIQQPLSFWEKLLRISLLRKAILLIGLVALWEITALRIDNPLIMPAFSAVGVAFEKALFHGELLNRIMMSLKILVVGYGSGVLLAGVLTVFAVNSRLGTDLLELATAMFNPLPAIALVPLALLWFGIGAPSIIFVLVQSVVWPIALNVHSGFTAVSPTLRMVGRNYGLNRLGFVTKILIPGAFPNILTGLKIGWAFAWRTLIAAELVFGVSSGSGGLGWFIYEQKNQLEIPAVFAGLMTVIIIGILVENLIFQTVERRTVRRWGMKL